MNDVSIGFVWVVIIGLTFVYIVNLIGKDARKRGMPENAWCLAVVFFAPVAIPAYLVAVEITKLKQVK